MIWFVTPAFQRFELTRVCLEQRRRVLDFLAEKGVDGGCVVIADDANADTADELGFDVIRRPNYALGKRFNDGIQYAAQHGAEWIVPIGSDVFIDPAYFWPLPSQDVIRASHLCAVAEPTRLGRLRVPRGVGPYVLPRKRLPKSLRPANDWRKRGVDGSTLQGMRHPWRREFVDLHPYQHIGFLSGRPPQMNGYDKLYRRLGRGEESEVAERLSQYYPADLVERALLACAPLVEAVA